MLFARHVGGKRGNGGGNRAGALQDTPDDDAVNIAGEEQEAEDDDRLPSETVRSDPYAICRKVCVNP